MTSKRQSYKQTLRRPPNHTLRLQQSWRRDGKPEQADDKKVPPKAA